MPLKLNIGGKPAPKPEPKPVFERPFGAKTVGELTYGEDGLLRGVSLGTRTEAVLAGNYDPAALKGCVEEMRVRYNRLTYKMYYGDLWDLHEPHRKITEEVMKAKPHGPKIRDMVRAWILLADELPRCGEPDAGAKWTQRHGR